MLAIANQNFNLNKGLYRVAQNRVSEAVKDTEFVKLW